MTNKIIHVSTTLVGFSTFLLWLNKVKFSQKIPKDDFEHAKSNESSNG